MGKQSLVLPEEFNAFVREAGECAEGLKLQLRGECSNAIVALIALIGLARNIAKEQGLPLEVLGRMAEKGVMEIIAGTVTLPAHEGEPA